MRLKRLISEEKKNNSSGSRFGDLNDLVFGESLDSMDLQKFLGMSDEYANKVEEDGEKMIEKEIRKLDKDGRQNNDKLFTILL